MGFWQEIRDLCRKSTKRPLYDNITPEGMWSTYEGIRIETWCPEPDEVIILRPNRHESVDSYMSVYSDLRKNFPENKIVIIPEEMEFRHMSNENLIRYFMDICELIIAIGKEPYASRFTDEDDD